MMFLNSRNPVITSSVIALVWITSGRTWTAEPDDYPLVDEAFEIALFAREPLVRNPCALAFDARGRLCVGMGPQYRSPEPDTPGDTVWILLDDDADGRADRRLAFATGFNAIQGLAWRGDALWVANAPDLTVVRDLDGDDEADEYVRLYTDLGNLEHGLHGLQWGPDGKLYMSKGNSKGLTRPNRLAPKPFRDLWGVSSPPGAPDFPEPVRFSKSDYQKNYHDPSDDWGLCGGVLRCDPDGSGLEIVAKGCRNPWDIAYDDGFDWLGTDNDQTQGDKFIAPFFGAHFGWGHPWSYDWKGDAHLPSAPSAGPLFEGSGTGVLHLGLDRYPESYRDVFLVNDWLRRQILIYRPSWDGAWMQPGPDPLEVLVDAGSGRSMQRSSGRSFDPVDLEVGPDGAIYISSWGREYGASVEDGEMTNEGRIYRLWPKQSPPQPWSETRDPWKDLNSHLAVWRNLAQETLLEQGKPARNRLQALLEGPAVGKRMETWALWTLGRMEIDERDLDDYFERRLRRGESLNRRLQALRILAHRARLRGEETLPETVRESLGDHEARVRHEAVLSMHQVGETRWKESLIDLAAREEDRLVFYSCWQSFRKLLPETERRALLADTRPGVRRASLLSLLEDDALDEGALRSLREDTDPVVIDLVAKRLGGKDEIVIKGPRLSASAEVTENESIESQSPISVVSALRSESGRAYEEATLRPGAFAYLDRSFRLRDLPEALVGETFIQASNDDADPKSGTSLTLTLRDDSTIFLADDARGERLPTWARDLFEPTEWRLHNGDAEMRVYRAEFPAGEAVFGPNREGVNARKGQYLLIIRPRLIDPPAKAPTTEEVRAALPEANPERGRRLFLSPHGATCVTCHAMEGRGNVFAPDLSAIGSRADAGFLIRSILEPSAEITEGFVMQMVRTQDDETFGGIILNETARSLTLGMVGGRTVTLNHEDIETREAAEVSAMPPLAPLLQAQQVADLVGYLLQQNGGAKTASTVGPANEQGNASDNGVAGRSWGSATDGFQLLGHEDRLEIRLDGRIIADYHFLHKQTRRPFFANVKTPDGRLVTRHFPPREGIDPTDHAFMHPGLSLGFANVSGVNFWHNNEGVVVHEGFVGEPSAGESARFSVRNRYVNGDGHTICREHARHAISLNSDGYLITIETTFSSERPFSFGVKEEMGLALRVATPIRVRDGNGSILSAGGGRNEEGTWGLVDRWWDYAGEHDGGSIGVMIMSGPGNPEVWAHSRDYGVLVANPFPVDRAENRDKQTTIEPGETFRLRFGIQVHEHGGGEDFDREAAYARYRESLED